MSNDAFSDFFYDQMLWQHEDEQEPIDDEDHSDYLHGDPFDDTDY